MILFKLSPAVKNYVLMCLVAVAFSSFTLWLVESWLRYAFFLAEFLAIIIIFLTLHSSSLPNLSSLPNFLKSPVTSVITLHRSHMILFLLPFFAITLLALNTFHLTGGITQQILALLATSILPGYAILNLTKMTCHFSMLEVIVFSGVLSFIVSGGLNLMLLSLDTIFRTEIFLIIYLVLGVVSILSLLANTHKFKPREQSLCSPTDILALALSIAFFIMVYLMLYPDATLLPNSDVARHYRDSVILSRNLNFYVDSNYALFHAFQASVQMLSGDLVSPYQNMLVAFNLILPLAVYVLAKRFLGEVDKKIPAIATILYVFLSNYSFIYFSQLKLQGTFGYEFQLLAGSVAEKTFNGTINFVQPFVFLFPMSVSFIIFISAFSLLKNRDIPRGKYIAFMSVLILGMYLTHVTEAVIFAILLAFYALIRASRIRLKDSLISALIAFGISVFFAIYTALFWGMELRKPEIRLELLYAVAMPLGLVIFGIVYLLFVKSVRPRIPRKLSTKFFLLTSIGLSVLYLGSFVTWFYDKSFGTSAVDDVGVVPWFIYPLMLGTAGLLTILSIKYTRSETHRDAMTMILLTIGFLFLTGRALSLINLNIFVSGYWEKRFIFFLFLFCCLVSPIPLIRLKDRFVSKRIGLRNVAFVSLISVIILSGFSSIVLQAEYLYAGTKHYKIDNSEREAVDFLRNVINYDSRALVIGLSKQSSDALTFAAPSYLFSKPELAISSRYPEVAMTSLTAHNLPHAYIYLHLRDFPLLQEHEQTWFKSYLRFLPIVFSNQKVIIFNASSTNYPSINAPVNFVIPWRSIENSWKYSYLVMAGSTINYTTNYDIDQNALAKKVVILGFDPAGQEGYHTDFSNLIDWNVVSGKWNITFDGLQAGDRTNEIERIILSPISANSFVAGTLFRVPENNNNQTAKYASIIYSYTNATYFKYANVIFSNGKIYLSLASVVDGVRSFYPNWPGVLLTKPVKDGSSLNLTISVDAKYERLILNGSRYVMKEGQSQPGDIGLGYGRLDNLDFRSFTFRSLDPTYVRNISSYVEFAKGGGQLLVLNPNGRGSIDHFLTAQGNNSTTSQVLITPFGESMQSVTSLRTANKNNQTNMNMTIREINLGSGKITYIDVFPVIQEWVNQRIPTTTFFSTLSGVLDGWNIHKISEDHKSFKDIKAIFSSFNSTGLVNLHSNSFLIPSNFRFDRVEIESGLTTHSLRNVTILSINDYLMGNLLTDGLSVHDGEGLYSNAYFNAKKTPLTISFDPSARLSVLSSGKTMTFSTVHSISFQDDRIFHMTVREPSISVQGVTNFEKFSSGGLFSRTGVDGQTLRVVGNTSLDI